MSTYDPAFTAYLEQFVTPRRREILRQVLQNRTRHLTVVLEDLYQMHNISAVVRSCDIFGIQDVHIIRKHYDARISHGIAKGAEKWLTLHEHRDTADTIRRLREAGYRIVATTPHRSSVLLPDFDVTRKAAFFFGVEKDGLSPVVMEMADEYLKIPMYGFTESFNISVAAALILYETTRKLRASDIDWRLSPEEQAALYQQWLERSIKKSDMLRRKFYGSSS
ncbi:MAG: RNA methyltransferase [Chlorobi bacterium]|nr:RNA methyltransferase [Chlorobiota bacterium]